MISHCELQSNAKTRLNDAKILYEHRHYDGAVYLCGYAVELALKAIICKNLKLEGIPNTSKEFDTIVTTIQKLKTHNLGNLLVLAGQVIETDTKQKHLEDWSVVLNWDPEMRYAPIKGQLLKSDASSIIKATSRLLRYFFKKL